MKTHSLIAHIGFLTFFSLLQITCKKDPPVVPPIEPPPYAQSIFLAIADSGLTEVYLSLSMSDTLPPRGFEIFRNNSKILSGSLFGKETTLVDTTAIMNTSYTYQAFRVDNAMRTDSSAVVATRTLDTTSHEFVWTIDTIGAIGSFHTDLYDVTIVNENEVWIGGLIFTGQDSAGNDIRYNLVRWDGQSFTLHRVQHRFWTTFTGIVVTHGMYNFGRNNIIATAGSSVMHWDGNMWTYLSGLYNDDPELAGDVSNALWGTSLNNFYGVGNKGKIHRWNGSSWSRMPVNTTVDLKDIAGTPDGENMWACGSNQYEFSPSTLLRYQNGQWKKIWEGDPLPFRSDSLSGHLTGLLIPSKQRALVLSRYGVYTISSVTNQTVRRNSFVPQQFPGFPRGIRGNGENDFFVVGTSFMVAHYNGNTWKHFSEFSMPGGIFQSVAMKDNLVVITGTTNDSFNSRGIIIIGKRQ
jgi:hypothetical protein